MGKKIFLLLITLMAVTLNGMSKPQKIVFFEKGDNNQHIQLTANQKFTITLPANPSTGYRWTIADTSFACFRECRPDTFMLRSDAKKEGTVLVGVGGHQQFFFQAMNHGDCVLRLHYQRSWEKKQPPVDTFQLFIKIHK